MKTYLFIAGALVAAHSGPAFAAQRSQEDVLTSAEDAFGTTVGGETIGLYGPMNARGFSPVQAGNLRLDGVYFDARTVGGTRVRISSRLTSQANVHVGLSAQSYPFMAPTGIASYILRVPGDEFALSTVVRGGYPESQAIELEGQIPFGESFSLGLGISGERLTDNGRMSYLVDGAAVGRWNVGDVAQVIPFYSRTREFDKAWRPFLFAGGAAFPPKFDRTVDLLPEWATSNNDDSNFGAIVKASWDEWRVSAGLFRSLTRKAEDESTQVHRRNIQANGMAEIWTVRVAPDILPNASVSGEARLSRLFLEGDRRHTFHFNVRGKSTKVNYGGNVSRLAGTADYRAPVTIPEPTYAPGPRGREFARQGVAGVGYEGIWKGVGEFSAGLQRTRYTRHTTGLGATPSESTNEWLYNSTVAAYLSEKLVLYGSYTRGLEDAPRAPPFAVNSGASASAALTQQIDAGFRYSVLPGVNLVAGVFEVKKPFFELDPTGFFGELGDVNHRGIEASLSGSPMPGLTVVAGLVALQARLSGTLVDNGTMGRVETEAVPLTGIFNIQYGPASWKGLSLDARVNYKAASMANVENTFKTRPATTVNVGARYRFRLSDQPATLRLQVANLFDVWEWEVQGTQRQVSPLKQREITLQLAVDY